MLLPLSQLKLTPDHLGGFDLPFVVGLLFSMLFSGIIAAIIGKICLRLRGDYWPVATIRWQFYA